VKDEKDEILNEVLGLCCLTGVEEEFVERFCACGCTSWSDTFMIMSNTKTSPYLRLARSPHGPTLTFKIHAYSLAADIARTQSRPRAPPAIFKSPPLVSFDLL